MNVTVRRNLAAALAVFALLASACAAGNAGSSAELNVWPTGTSATYAITSAQSQAMEIPGMGEQVSNSTSTIEFEVAAIGVREFSIKVLNASSTSDTPDDGMMPDISTLVGLEAMLTLNERGEIAEASGIGGNPYVEAQGGEEAYTEELRGLFLYLPEEQVRPGVTWTREYGFTADQMGIELQFQFSDIYRCVEETVFEGTRALKIESEQKISLGGGGEQMGTLIDLALTGTGDGVIIVDAVTGMLLSGESKGSMSGGLAAQGMDIPMTMTMTSSIKVK
ncbi:hypothetical protein ACFL6T_00500 [Candidatus Zixiibacteriota bacterium]